MNCKNGAIQLIDSIINTIEAIDVEQYNMPLAVYNGSTFGKHFRHIYDFFQCLVLQSGNPSVDYCERCRDENIEESKSHAVSSFIALKAEMALLDESKEIIVHADFEIEEGIRPRVKTSIGREVMYAYDHAVHHLAIIKIGLKEVAPQTVIDQNMGVAASTIRHQFAND